MGRTDLNATVKDLLGKLTPFIVTQWGVGSQAPAPGTDRETGDLNEAHVISSLIKGTDDPDRAPCLGGPGGQHHLLLDIDLPAALVESSTPGHFHLYVELNDGFGIAWEPYKAFLEAAAAIGLIEPGYAEVSIKRGHTDLRLPWVDKSSARPVPHCVGCGKAGHEIAEYRDMVLAEWHHEHPNDEAPDEFTITDAEINDWIYRNEGTINGKTGMFSCTSCYIKQGQPLLRDCAWLPEHAKSVEQELAEGAF